MIYKFHAPGKMGINGVEVRAGHLVATVDTDYILDDILASIRLRKFTVSNSESVLTPVAEAKPPPVETTTKEQTPVTGKAKKSKWAGTR